MCNYHLKYLELRVDYIYIVWTTLQSIAQYLYTSRLCKKVLVISTVHFVIRHGDNVV